MWHHQEEWVTCRNISISSFLCYFLIPTKCFIFSQTPFYFDVWLPSYEEFINAKNNINQKNLNTLFANNSKSVSPTSDLFLLSVSQLFIIAILGGLYIKQTFEGIGVGNQKFQIVSKVFSIMLKQFWNFLLSHCDSKSRYRR